MAVDYPRVSVELASWLFLNSDPNTNDGIANIYCYADNLFASVSQYFYQAMVT